MPTVAKEQWVEVLEKGIREAKGVILAGYQGLTVQELEELRKKLRPLACEYRVVKNTLTRRALEKAGLWEFAKFVEGPSAVILEKGDIVAPAKVLMDFAKEHERLQVKAAYLSGKVLSGQDVKALASLPAREVLLAQLLGLLKSPLTSLVNVFQAPVRVLAGVLDAIAKKGEP